MTSSVASEKGKVLEILHFPDPILRKVGRPVDGITPELQQLAGDMLATMYDSNGIGLAAPQIGKSVRLLVMDTRPRENGRYTLEGLSELEQTVPQPLVIFNPVIISRKGKQTYEEGCLSVPSYYETVERSDIIEVEGMGPEGEKLKLKLDGLMSVCMQHEIDHLDGKLFIDRLSTLKGQRLKSRILKEGYPKKEEEETV